MTVKAIIKQTSVALISAIALFCANTIMADEGSLNAQVGFIGLTHFPKGADEVNPIRFAAIRQAALSLGAQGGLAWQARNIDMALHQECIFLDQIFDFNQLLLNHNALPPVLIESNNNLVLDDNDTLRIDTKTYRIIRPARFVTAPPNWRDYLWMRFARPGLPDRSLLPQSKAEADVWNHYFKEGWMNGTQLASTIFTSNLNRLKRDFIGMVLYRKLLAQRMVSAPFVAKAQLGVTGDATQLRIDDQVLRITAQSKLQPNPSKWTPIITK